MGRWWERLVRTVKSSLKKTLHFLQVEKIELETIITEIESIINSRPLTYVSDDPSDQGPLTPAHFLLGKPVSIGEVGDDSFTFSSRELLFCHSIKQNIINKFWDLWHTDYLRNLPPAISKPCHVKNLKVGDLVMIQGENKFFSPNMAFRGS